MYRIVDSRTTIEDKKLVGSFKPNSVSSALCMHICSSFWASSSFLCTSCHVMLIKSACNISYHTHTVHSATISMVQRYDTNSEISVLKFTWRYCALLSHLSCAAFYSSIQLYMYSCKCVSINLLTYCINVIATLTKCRHTINARHHSPKDS